MTMVLPSRTGRAVVARAAVRIRGCPLPHLHLTEKLNALSSNRDLGIHLGRRTETMAGSLPRTPPQQYLCRAREVELAARKKNPRTIGRAVPSPSTSRK